MRRLPFLWFLCLSFGLSGCGGPPTINSNPFQENIPVVGTGEIAVYFVDFENSSGALKSLYSRPEKPVKRDRYVSLILHSTYLVDLPELFGEREYKVALTVTSGDKQATRIIDGVFEPPGRLNFSDFPLLLDVVYTGKPINIKMDIIELDEQSKEQWKQYIDMAGGIFSIASKTFLPGGDTLTQIAKGIVDVVTHDDPNQFPFNITLHEADTSTLNTVSPLIDSKYVFSALRTEKEPQVWTEDDFEQKVNFKNGKLYNQGKEFRARSYLMVTVRAKDKRESYSDEDFAKVYRKATGFAAQVIDWENGRYGQRALAALDDAQEMVNQQQGVLTLRDIDARRFFYNTKRFMWLAAKVPCDSQGKDEQCRETTRIYFRNAIDNFLRIPEYSFPTDDITENDYRITKEYLCGAEVKNYLYPKEWTEKGLKLCAQAFHYDGQNIFVHHVNPPPINLNERALRNCAEQDLGICEKTFKANNRLWLTSNHVYPPTEDVKDVAKEASDFDTKSASSKLENSSKHRQNIYTPKYRQNDLRVDDENILMKSKESEDDHHVDPPPTP